MFFGNTLWIFWWSKRNSKNGHIMKHHKECLQEVVGTFPGRISVVYLFELSVIVWPSSEINRKYVGILRHTGKSSGLRDHDLKTIGNVLEAVNIPRIFWDLLTTVGNHRERCWSLWTCLDILGWSGGCIFGVDLLNTMWICWKSKRKFKKYSKDGFGESAMPGS